MPNTWPATLPQAPLVDGYRQAVGDSRVRTEMAQGPAKVRRTTTAAVGAFGFPLLLTSGQLDDLLTFYEDTLEGGSLTFDFTDPRTSASLELRPLDMPVWEKVGEDSYKLMLTFEVMP